MMMWPRRLPAWIATFVCSPVDSSASTAATLGSTACRGRRRIPREILHRLTRRQREKRPCMSFCDPPFVEGLLNLSRQLQQPQRVRDRGLALTQPRGDLLLGHPELVVETLVGTCLFQRAQVFSLQVLEEGDL